MTVLQNIMLGIPKRSRFGMVDWRAIARRRRADRRARRRHRAARRQRQRPVDGRELADQHLPRAGAQGAADRDGRADGIAVGERKPSGCSPSSATCRPRACRCSTCRTGSQEILDALRPRHRLSRRPLDEAVREEPSSRASGLVEAIVGGTPAAEERVAALASRGGRVVLRVHGLTRSPQGRRRQLRPARGRGAGSRRPGRRRPHRAGPADLRRRSSRRRRHDAGRPAVRPVARPMRRSRRASVWCRRSGAPRR